MTLDSNGGAITATTIAGGAQDLILAASVGGGTTTISGAVSALGDGTGASLTVSSGVTGLVWFQNTVGANSGIQATGGAQTVRFDGDVTLGDGNTGTAIATTQLDGLTFSCYDGLGLGALTLSGGAVTLDSNGGAITATTIAGGSQDLILAAGVAVGRRRCPAR